MAGTFTVTCSQSANGSSSSREVKITVSSQNGYSETVTLTFSAVPNTGSVSLSDDTEQVSVPKNGETYHLVTADFTSPATKCNFTAAGTDGTLNHSHTIEVKPLSWNGGHPAPAKNDPKAAKPAKPKAPKK